MAILRDGVGYAARNNTNFMRGVGMAAKASSNASTPAVAKTASRPQAALQGGSSTSTSRAGTVLAPVSGGGGANKTLLGG